MDIKGYLLNCFIDGEHSDTSSSGICRNQIRLLFAGYDILIAQHPEVLNADPKEYKGQSVETTEVTFFNVNPSDIEEVVEKLRGLATLLSLITCSQVVLHGWECLGVRQSGAYWSVIAKAGFSRPILKVKDGKAVREFLEQTCHSYFQLEKPRKLRVAIDYFVSSQVLVLPFELKLTTMFILLENLKATYALTQGYQYKKRYYQKPTGGHWSFKNLLLDMFQDVDMGPSIDSIIALRNEIIHSGISQMPFIEQEKIYEDCQDIVREYFMRLLGFSGYFCLYSGRGMKTINLYAQTIGRCGDPR